MNAVTSPGSYIGGETDKQHLKLAGRRLDYFSLVNAFRIFSWFLVFVFQTQFLLQFPP